MKDHFRPVAIFAMVTLVITGGVVAQTTYALPTGQTLTVINQLPETFSQHFNDEELVRLLRVESSRGVNPLDIELVVEHGTALWAWINSAQRTAPSDVLQAFRSEDWNAHIIFQKADEMVTFQGFLDNSGGRCGFRMGMRQPITYASESLGEHKIYTDGYEDVMLGY